MRFSVKVKGNASNTIKALETANYNLKIVVLPYPHYSGMTCRELAHKLSVGDQNMEPRPFMKQFFAEHKQQLLDIVKSSAILGVRGLKKEQQLEEAGWKIVELLRQWVRFGGVTPRNTPYTAEKKGHDRAVFQYGDLIEAIAPVVIKKAKK